MKNIIDKIFVIKVVKLVVFGLFLMGYLRTQAQVKRGFIVAIGDYPQTSADDRGWRDISSANDVPLIRTALQKQGFLAQNIDVLQDSLATKEAIVKGFEKLIASAKSGDVIFIHFSSHGQQVEDLNGDELDGFDEAIVAYGAPAFYEDDYDFSKHLLDDEIEVFVLRLRQKVGPKGDVIMLADACHSGTVGRGEEIARGGKPAMKRTNAQIQAKGSPDIGLFQNEKMNQIDKNLLAPFVIISASQAKEVNYEYNGAGSLSTAFSRSIDHLNGDMTYRAFFGQILKEMSVIAPSQKPAIEGDVDRVFFAGQIVEQEPFYTSFKIKNNEAWISGGNLNGIFEGSEIAIFPIGTSTTSDKKSIATGEVIVAYGTWSKIRMSETLSGSEDDYWFFVTKASMGNVKLNIKISFKDKSIKNQLIDSLAKVPLFYITEDDVDYIIEDGGRNNLDIVRASDGEIVAEQIGLDEIDDVVEILKQFARGNYIKNLELSDPSFNVAFEFLPVIVDEDGFPIEELNIEELTHDGIIEIPENICAKIRVINKGRKDAYFSILDIQPDGKINGIIPSDDPELHQNPEEFFVKAGDTMIIKDLIIYFGAPYGMEVFKLFASKGPIDFTPVITKKPRTRSKVSNLETLFDDVYNVSSRGATSRKIESTGMEATTHSITFVIKKN
ncbi:MAG: caspase family protein [Flavobacteriales bacterium]|nr:caspase family protein [Flavobacteriales bacterium]